MMSLRTWGTLRAACRHIGPYAGILGRMQACLAGIYSFVAFGRLAGSSELIPVMVPLLSGGSLEALRLFQ